MKTIDNIINKFSLGFLTLIITHVLSVSTFASLGFQYDIVSSTPQTDAFPLVATNSTAVIYKDSDDYAGVIRAIGDLQLDIERVTGKKPDISDNSSLQSQNAVIIGTIGKSKLIDSLISNGKIKVDEIKGKWECFMIATVDNPLPGIARGLIIAGSDRRGTIYGIYELSEQLGVSPWYWWADVPVKKRAEAYIIAGRYVSSEPKVKYRGIFINDESPSFTGWANSKFGGVNSKMYAHMFELLLRLRANYLWPAMWGNAFNEDDPLSPVVANEYGIVMGTSHHEPMMRAHKEYTSRKNEIGPWDYSVNEDNLKKFFEEGLERNKNFDNLITIGMRGDGDQAMGKGDDGENIRVLTKVVEDQRNIIRKVYGKEPSEVPQLWAIFTEVQRYYDAGMTVPDDVTLLFCDNNWGYIRRTGPQKEKDRSGGMGLYYHIDMNGGPWNDRWVNTTTIAKLREQLNLAYQTGLNRIWIINVGDLKPKELPIDFIMRYAWNPELIQADDVKDYTVNWAKNIFGAEYAQDIADIVSKYSKYNLLRKPEVQSPDIFSFVNYREAETMLKKWHDVVAKAEDISTKIAPEAKDAYYQLVLYPAKASAGLAEMYISAGYNNLYAAQGRVSANDYARRARELFELDKELSAYYNDTMAGGKWKNMMSDKHIGYQAWSMPRRDELPRMTEVTPLTSPVMAVALEGNVQAWPGSDQKPKLPVFDSMSRQSYYIDVFNRGVDSFEFSTQVDKTWLKLSETSGKVSKETRLFVTIDWDSVPNGKSNGTINIRSGDTTVSVEVNVISEKLPTVSEPYFGSLSGEFSIPSHKFSANIAGKDAKWIVLPDLGRDQACMGIYPVTSASAELSTAPRLEYRAYLSKAGKNRICLGILPTQDINSARGLRIAVSIDDETPQILDARKGLHDEFKEYTEANLARSKVLKPLPPLQRDDYVMQIRNKPRRTEVFDNMRWLDVDVNVETPGLHTIKIFMVDPEVVLEKIIVNPDFAYPSYFGAPPVQHNTKE